MTTGLPSVSVPVLSKATAVIVARPFEDGAALQEEAAAGAGGEAGGDGGGVEMTSAQGQPMSRIGKALVDPFAPRLRRQNSGGRMATRAPTTRTPGV